MFLKHPQGIHVHNGPRIDSDQVNHNSSVIHLSSFQAFVVIFIDAWPNQDDHLSEFGLSYLSRIVKATEIHIHNSVFLSLPPCEDLKQTVKMTPKEMKMTENEEEGKEKMNHENCHCVYKITSEMGYVNLSITSLTYIGVDFEDLNALSQSHATFCYHGGVGVSIEIAQKDPSMFQMKHFCNNYTSNPDTEKKYDNSLMSIVSNTTDGLLLVVYSFKHYSQVSVQATVTSTPCKGLVIYKSMCFPEFLRVYPHIGLFPIPVRGLIS